MYVHVRPLGSTILQIHSADSLSEVNSALYLSRDAKRRSMRVAICVNGKSVNWGNRVY